MQKAELLFSDGDPFELNGESFTLRHLEPFGTELIPQRGVVSDVQALITRDLESVRRAADAWKLVVVSQAGFSPTQSWREIPPHTENTIHVPHQDHCGESEILMWQIRNGANRSPTAVVPKRAVLDALPGLKDELITPAIEGAGGAHYKNLVEVRSRLGKGDFDGAIEALLGANRQMCGELTMDGLLSNLPKPGLVSRIFSKRGADEEPIYSGARASCQAALRRFCDSLIRAVSPNTYLHNWRSRPNSALIVQNAGPERPTGVLHCGTSNNPDGEGILLRAFIRDGNLGS